MFVASMSYSTYNIGNCKDQSCVVLHNRKRWMHCRPPDIHPRASKLKGRGCIYLRNMKTPKAQNGHNGPKLYFTMAIMITSIKVLCT